MVENLALLYRSQVKSIMYFIEFTILRIDPVSFSIVCALQGNFEGAEMYQRYRAKLPHMTMHVTIV